MRLLNFLMVMILCVGFSSAISICIDRTVPSAPSNLAVSGEVGNILLTWAVATDEPNCSGIEEYVISREGFEIGRVDGDVLNFTDSNESLEVGNYSYTVYAVDMVGHNTGSAVINVVSIEGEEKVVQSGGGGGSGGGSSGSFLCVENWTCGNWSECVDNGQVRFCEDLKKCGTVNYKPEVSRWCEVGYDDLGMTLVGGGVEDGGDENGFFSTITGAVTGAVGTVGGMAVSVFVLLALGGFFAVRFRKKKVIVFLRDVFGKGRC